MQAGIEEFLKYNSLQKLVSGWETGEDQKSKSPKMIAETVRLLAQRLETKVLECLERDVHRFYCIANDYNLRELPKQVLFDLILRTSFILPVNIIKCVESIVSFRCVGGKWMKVYAVRYDRSQRQIIELYPSWFDAQIEFTSPGGKRINLPEKGEDEHEPLDLEKLTPVTELLQEGISLHMQEEDRIPKIGNRLTAAYFLEASCWLIG